MKTRLIEIEIFNYCNRVCEFCPNSIIDRKSNFKLLNMDIYIKLLNELKDLKYKGVLTYSRYNEPMSHSDIFKKYLNKAKEILPDVKLISNTNGDFINKENMQDLNIDELTIMNYDNKPLDYILTKLKNANINIEKIEEDYIHASFNNIKILVVVNFSTIKLNNRGGVLAEIKSNIRIDACFEPTYFIGIDYTGDVVPCCNIRHDINSHKPYIFGNIYKSTLKHIIDSSKYNDFKTNCANGIFQEHSPCYTCNKEAGRYTKNIPSINY